MLWCFVVRELIYRNTKGNHPGLAGLELNALESAQTANGLIDWARPQMRVNLGHLGAGAVACVANVEGYLDLRRRAS